MAEVKLPEFEFDPEDFEIQDMPDKSPEHIEVPEWILGIARTLDPNGRWKRYTPKPGKGSEAMAKEFARLMKGAGRYMVQEGKIGEDKSINAIAEGVGVRFHVVGKRGAKPKNGTEETSTENA